MFPDPSARGPGPRPAESVIAAISWDGSSPPAVRAAVTCAARTNSLLLIALIAPRLTQMGSILRAISSEDA